MEERKITKMPNIEEIESEFKQLQVSLPLDFWMGIYPINLYQGYWCACQLLESTISLQAHFEAHDTDIILASLPKTGTTWLKSLLFAIVNRKKYSDFSQHPLRTRNAHELVLQLEAKVYKKIRGSQPDITNLSSPRLFSTHVPYLSLPQSMKTSKCPIIYVCRDPLDTFVSSWHFYRQLKVASGFQLFYRQLKENMSFKHWYRQLRVVPGFKHFYRQGKVNMIEEDFVKFSEGKFPYGPYEDHVLGYWKESMQDPKKVFFMEYEGLKADPKVHVKKLAEFVGCPFSKAEEEGGVIEDIIKLCSLESLKEMEVNKSGNFYGFFENKTLFRKGEVGGWSNYLTPSMVKRFDEIFQEKFKGSNFAFQHYQPFSQAPKSFSKG